MHQTNLYGGSLVKPKVRSLPPRQDPGNADGGLLADWLSQIW